MLTIVGLILTAVIVIICYDTWAEWQYKHEGAWEAAGIEPIPGSELIFYKDERSGFLPDYATTWIYKVPASYTDKLYKDCAAMHYETGPFKEYEKDGTERVGPPKSGCHTSVDRHRGFISVEFSGDQMTVEDVYGF